VSRVLGGSEGEGLFFMNEVPLYKQHALLQARGGGFPSCPLFERGLVLSVHFLWVSGLEGLIRRQV
jgi:hypothetical protein